MTCKFSFIRTAHKDTGESYADVLASCDGMLVIYPKSFADQNGKFIIVKTCCNMKCYTDHLDKYPQLEGLVPDESEYYQFMKDLGYDLMCCTSKEKSDVMNTLGDSGWRQPLPEELE